MRNLRAALRLTDFDRAVLAAARMGVLKTRVVEKFGTHNVHAFFMGDIRVDDSIARLAKAGELKRMGSLVQPRLIFPDTPEWIAHEKLSLAMAKLSFRMKANKGT